MQKIGREDALSIHLRHQTIIGLLGSTLIGHNNSIEVGKKRQVRDPPQPANGWAGGVNETNQLDIGAVGTQGRDLGQFPGAIEGDLGPPFVCAAHKHLSALTASHAEEVERHAKIASGKAAFFGEPSRGQIINVSIGGGMRNLYEALTDAPLEVSVRKV